MKKGSEPNTHSSETINLKRSDGKAHDLTSFAEQAQLVGRDSLDTTSADVESSHEHGINIKRSDGVTHDIVNVYKGKSESRGETAWRLPDMNITSTIRRMSFGSTEIGGIESGGPAAQGSSSSSGESLDVAYHPSCVRIVHMSDTHNFLHRSSKFNTNFLPSGDILIHSGNFSNNGTQEEYQQFNTWLSSVAGMYRYRVVVVGNRDVQQVRNNWDEVRARLSQATHVLCHSSADVLGLRLYGCPWYWGHKYNYSLRPGAPDSVKTFTDIPEGIDILISHGPAFGKLDACYTLPGESVGGPGSSDVKDIHCGSAELAAAIRRVRPSVHLHGHVIDSRGFVPPLGHNPLVVNSSMCDMDARVLVECPHVIEARQVFNSLNSLSGLSSSSGGVSSAAKSSKVGKSSISNLWTFEIGSLI